MKTFRTTFPIASREIKIDHNSKIMLLGSCFSDNIGQKLAKHKFHVLSNPYGVLYNPYSIQEALRHLLGERPLTGEDLVYHEGLWHSYLHHSSFSLPDKSDLLHQIEATRKAALEHLKNSKYLFITYGTAWVYQLKNTRSIVANCHKLPADNFHRFRLSKCDITDETTHIIDRISELNPELQIVFTLSPIRHLKDGFVENQLSKSILHVAIQELTEMFNNCSYFPSYEIVMDDLRDYRFYDQSMTHLAPAAVDYIWERFADVFITQKGREMIAKVEKIQKAIAHRPNKVVTPAYKKHLQATIDRIHKLQDYFPEHDWHDELSVLLKRMG